MCDEYAICSKYLLFYLCISKFVTETYMFCVCTFLVTLHNPVINFLPNTKTLKLSVVMAVTCCLNSAKSMGGEIFFFAYPTYQ